MDHIRRALAAMAILLAAVMSGCSNNAGTGETPDLESVTASRGEHDRDGGEQSGQGRGEGEESGTELALNQTYDHVRNGARLILAYDAPSNAFIGTVENTTDKTLKAVRVEVHLSNGKELGPTIPVDLDPGQKTGVKLAATSKGFDGWVAHPEVGSGEAGHGEGGGEHGGEAGSEHKGEHDREGSGEHK